MASRMGFGSALDRLRKPPAVNQLDDDAFWTSIDQIAQNVEGAQAAQKREAPQRAEADAVNARFGNDMAFLDPLFQQQAALLGQSAASRAGADPNSIAAQQKALDQLFGIAEGGGATALERARMQRARSDQEGWLRGQREADMQNMAERGMSGSGQELATLAMDRQAAAQRISGADLETEAMLEARALDALMKGSGLASQMRGQSFGEDYQRGAAADSFAALNQQAINSVSGANKDFLRNAWQSTIGRRDDWDKWKADRGVTVASGLLGSDIQQDQFGHDYGGKLAGADATAWNNANNIYGQITVEPSTSGAAAATNLYGDAIRSDAAATAAAGKGMQDSADAAEEAAEKVVGAAGSIYGGG